MAIQPFFKIVVESSDRDISDLITSFDYDRDVEKDDLLKITLELDTVDEIDDDDFVEGKILIFKYGLVEGKVSKKRKVKIKSALPNLGRKIKLILICHDLGTDIKRTTGQRIYKGKTSSQIATEIADDKGLDKNIQTTKIVWQDMPTGNKSEFELLKYLAEREEDGDFIFFVSDNVLNFIKRDLSEESTATHTYDDGDGAVLSFKPSYKEAESDPGASATSMSDFDVVVNNENVLENVLGELMVHFDQDAIEIGRTGGESGKKGREIVTPAKDKIEATNLAKSVKKTSMLKTLTARLTLELDPLHQVNKIITMKGVSQKFSGNWYITGIRDKIDTRGITTLMLAKNSTKRSLRSETDTNDANTINKDVGPNEPESTIELVIFDEDGNEIGRR